MKKFLLSSLILLCTTIVVNAQATYYWVGGAGSQATATSFAARTNWSFAIGGVAVGTTGTIAFTPADVFIFSGADIDDDAGTQTGSISIAMTSLTATGIGQLKVIDSADVSFCRNATTGTSSFFINGITLDDEDLYVSANSKLTLTAFAAFGGSFVMQLLPGATGHVYGTLQASASNTTNNQNRFTFFSPGAVRMHTGAKAITGPLNPTAMFGTTSSSITPANGSVIFEAGSQLIYRGGYSPFGTTASSTTGNPADNIPVFQPGSLFVFEGTNVGFSLFRDRRYGGDVKVTNNSTVLVDGVPFYMGNLTIDAGSTLMLDSSAVSLGVSGNIINNGVISARQGIGRPSRSTLIFAGTSAQALTGTGSFSTTEPIGAITVSNVSNATLGMDVTVGSDSVVSNISGKLDFQTFKIKGIGAFNARSPQTINAVADINQDSAFLRNVTNISSLSVGMGVSDATSYIPANTVIIGLNPIANVVTISKLPIIPILNAPGSPVVFSATKAQLVTSSTGGFDSTAGVIATTGTKTLGTVDYTFNAATTTPFNTSPYNANNAGDVTVNAAITTNKSIITTGTLTLNSGKITIRSIDTITVSSGNAIAGGTFNAAKYFVTDKSGNNVGVLKMSGLSSASLFPIGSATNYLPVTLTPTSAGDGFATSVFEGITTNATAAGTAMSAAQKAKVVDAVWSINRTSTNTTNTTVAVNWPASLEGSSFAGYGNNIGVARYEGTAWGVVGGSGDNGANTAANSFASFSAFAVGELGFALPVKFVQVNAAFANNAVNVNWNVGNELSINNYLVERSSNGVEFTTIGSVNATNNSRYNFVDASPFSGNNFYRIKAVGKGGDITYSTTVRVNTSVKGHNEIAVYPNPIKGKLLNLQLTGMDEGKYTLTIINNIGQQIFTQSLGIISGNQNIAIPLNAIQNGMYNLIIKNEQQQLQKTIFVQ